MRAQCHIIDHEIYPLSIRRSKHGWNISCNGGLNNRGEDLKWKKMAGDLMYNLMSY